MDLRATINALLEERDKLDRAIQMLEGLQSGEVLAFKSRRGRKSMGPEERKVVAERMKRYWASQRKNKG